MDFREFLRQGFVVLDGATGSNLQQAGMESGDCPEQWIAKHPEVFIDLQCRYIEAGSVYKGHPNLPQYIGTVSQ